MTEAERIEYVIKTLESGNAAEFGRKVGVAKPIVTRMRKVTTKIRLHINKIIEAYGSNSLSFRPVPFGCWPEVLLPLLQLC